jgi:hypothetical protein
MNGGKGVALDDQNSFHQSIAHSSSIPITIHDDNFPDAHDLRPDNDFSKLCKKIKSDFDNEMKRR